MSGGCGGEIVQGIVRVNALIVGAAKGPKIKGFTYKPKSNQRKRWGHRQKHSLLEITAISPGDKK